MILKNLLLPLVITFLFAQSAQAEFSCSAYCVSTEDKFLEYAYLNPIPLNIIHLLQEERVVGGNGYNFEYLTTSCQSFIMDKFGTLKGQGTFLLVQISQTTGKLVGASPQSSCHPR